jgi:WD40 repeat protein
MTGSALAAPSSPYKGLAPFADSELDALFFFGREREIEIIAANLVAARLTVLYGPSGVGKTSLLRAGVAQRLRRDGGAVTVFSAWSGDPLEALFAAVEEEARRVAPGLEPPPQGAFADTLAGWTRRLGGDLYLILDQFEEYFLYHGDDEGGGPFRDVAEAVRRSDSRVHVLLSVREDALAQLDAFKTALPSLFGNSLRLDRLDRRAARRAIVGPLERHGELRPTERVEAEETFVEEVLDSVEAGRIQLGDVGRGVADEGGPERGRIEAPYLQLVLERVWEVERERRSKQLRLETLRELGGAARIVEDHLERAMEALTPAEKDAAAAMYNHLVTPSGTKIAHRAGDLARYAAVDEPEAQRVLERLVGERIVRAGEDGAVGPRYEIFHDVLADAVLAWRTRHEADRRLEHERLEAARRHRTLLGVAAASLVAVVLLSAVSIYALTQRSEARENAREARVVGLIGQAAASLATDPDRSLRLSLEASRKVRSSAVEEMLRESLTGVRQQDVVRLPAGESPAVLGPGGRTIATTRGDEVRLYRNGGTHLLRTFRHPEATRAELSSDGRRIATTGGDDMVRVWNVRTGRPSSTIVHPGPVSSMSFAPDSRELLTFGQHRVVYIWELPDAFNRMKLRLRGFVLAARFAPSGELVGTGGSDRIARLWDVRPKPVGPGGVPLGTVIRQFEGHSGRIGAVAFSADGALFGTGSTDGTAAVWKVAGGLVTMLPGHESFVTGVEFSPDGKLVATASRDRRARIFDARSPTLRATFGGHRAPIADLAWSLDSKRLVTSGEDGTVRTWDARPLPRLQRVRRHRDPVATVSFRSGRIKSSTAAQDALASRPRLRDAVDRVGRRTAVSLSPDERLAAVGYADGAVRLWDARSMQQVRDLPAHRARVTSTTFSRDGRSVVTTGADHEARLSEVESGRQRWSQPHSAIVSDADFSADGRWVAIAGPGEAGIVDAQTGERVLLIAGEDPILTAVAFSPTGWRIATGGNSGAVQTYDCRICGGIDELVKAGEEHLAKLRPKTP